MIIDQMNNAPLYHAIHPGFARAFEYIHHLDANTRPAGRYEIDGEFMYAMIQEYTTKLKEQGFWESHRRYIDLQYIVRGSEGIGYANIHHLQQGRYDSSKDFLPLYGDGDQIVLKSGSFVLLFPEDAHMPGMAVSSPAMVKKIVIKIAVD